ncbi:unnamed protein product [Hermetia illucens]|uniref:Cathepsin propeptide inhibitor domain-containing protein n=2 Tax=Hermetia illucens TaxID=343691 RepID=A0A7R8UTG8_HERIL|nr:unnamed protein product [Hermetia illucens]
MPLIMFKIALQEPSVQKDTQLFQNGIGIGYQKEPKQPSSVHKSSFQVESKINSAKCKRKFIDNKMKLVLLFTVFITLAAIKAQPVDKEGRTGPTGALDEEWENFKTKFNKRYKNAEEEEYRKGIFAKSLKKIQEHNKKYDAGEVSFKQGINHLADLTVNEYRAGYLGISKTVM